MKKYIILLFVCLGFAKAKAQTFHSYADTANYLIQEINNKKTFFIGKPFSILLDSLKIQPVEATNGNLKTDNFGNSVSFYFNHERVFNKKHFIIIHFDNVPQYAQIFPVFYPPSGGHGTIQSIIAIYQTLTITDVIVKDYSDDEPVNPNIHY